MRDQVAVAQIEYHAPLQPSFEAEIAKLRAAYQFERPDRVLEFLVAHPLVVPLLLEAVTPLRKAFGQSSALSLKTLDWDDGWILYADVQWTGEPAEAVAALDRFDNSWWLERSSDPPGVLVFNFELV